MNDPLHTLGKWFGEAWEGSLLRRDPLLCLIGLFLVACAMAAWWALETAEELEELEEGEEEGQ